MKKRYDYDRLSLLVNQSKAGDSSAFAELYTLTYNHVYNYALNYLRDPYMAQDAVQEIFIVTLRNLKQLKDPQLFVAWLNQISFHVCYRLQQKSANSSTVADLDQLSQLTVTDYDAIPESHVLKKDTLSVLKDAVESLPPLQKQTVYLRFFRNMKLEEIANTLEISRSTVKRSLASAKEKLRHYLKKSGQEGVTFSEFER